MAGGGNLTQNVTSQETETQVIVFFKSAWPARGAGRLISNEPQPFESFARGARYSMRRRQASADAAS